MNLIAERLIRIEDKIQDACFRSGRNRAEVTLIAVSKNNNIASIRDAFEAGCRDFGESRLQEALPKIAALPTSIRWHFIGKLQSNKAKRAAERFESILTLESESQLSEIEKQGRGVDGFIEVNISNEEQKSGVSAERLTSLVDQVRKCDRIRLLGLMAIGPANQDLDAKRSLFRSIRQLNHQFGCDCLSIGMSGDFEIAIEEGTTHIRIGSALFGDHSRVVPA